MQIMAILLGQMMANDNDNEKWSFDCPSSSLFDNHEDNNDDWMKIIMMIDDDDTIWWLSI